MVNLTYQAKDAEEFKRLVEWMRANGYENSIAPLKPAAKPAPARGEAGPYELEYRKVTGKQLRLKKEEIESGAAREDVARARLEEQGGSGAEIPPPPDDGEKMY